MDPQDELRQAVPGRPDHTVAERLLPLAEGGADLAVVRGSVDRDFAFAITLLNPTYMDPLYHSSTGHMLIILGLTMMVFGSLILRKIVSFKG